MLKKAAERFKVAPEKITLKQGTECVRLLSESRLRELTEPSSLIGERATLFEILPI